MARPTCPGRRCHRGDRRLALLASLLLPVALFACREPVAEPEEPLPPVEARASADPAVATTGDVITYTVTVEYDPDYEIDMAEPGAEIAGFRIIDLGREQPREVRGRIVEKRWYQMRADLVGSYILPALTISYWPTAGSEEGEASTEKGTSATGTVEISEIFVEVKSVLPADGEVTDIRDIKPLRLIETGPPWRLIIAVGAGLLLLAAAGLTWWWRRRRPVVVPAVPAHEIAFRALDELRQTDFSDRGAVRRYYFRISGVVRNYVEGRFGLNATDLTTEEILVGLDSLEDLQTKEGERLEDFLVDTDQVKFAAHVPSPAEIEETYDRALTFVEATRPVAAEAEEAVAS